jgi:broad specificity phosphatase PhoE
VTKLFLIRHGVTAWNQDRLYQGHSDITLSDLGKEQARLLGQRLVQEKIDAFYASDLNRALETARIIAEPHQQKVHPVMELRELNLGLWEGLTFQEIDAKYHELADLWYNSPSRLIIPGGETFAKLKERAYNMILTLVARHPEDTLAITSHGGTIRTIICAILGLDLDKVWCIQQDNTALNIINFYDTKTIISLLNDTSHLQANYKMPVSG